MLLKILPVVEHSRNLFQSLLPLNSNPPPPLPSVCMNISEDVRIKFMGNFKCEEPSVFTKALVFENVAYYYYFMRLQTSVISYSLLTVLHLHHLPFFILRTLFSLIINTMCQKDQLCNFSAHNLIPNFKLSVVMHHTFIGILLNVAEKMCLAAAICNFIFSLTDIQNCAETLYTKISPVFNH